MILAMLAAAFICGCGGSTSDLDGSKDVTEKTSVESIGDVSSDPEHSGSTSCRECHENFYKLWATSHHGLAMQPYSPQLAKEKLTPQKDDITIGKRRYRVDFGDAKKGTGPISRNGPEGAAQKLDLSPFSTARIIENGPNGKHEYPIVHVMGGKNVYYFLTPTDRGRLQTLPLAYDVNRKHWYDTTASAVRHFGDRQDEALDWREREYTFNASCFNCHVSQLSTNYDAKDNSYDTRWEEPGINCETCHGSAKEHLRVCREAEKKGTKPEDIKLTVVTQKHGFSPHAVNTSCAPCHAKMVPITTTYQPGDRYFDHFSLVGLEHPDFYPDGRDLGENYTYTTWRMSPCVKNGKLDCVHCHTSSGRYRHKDNPNQSCLPCHKSRVDNVAAHSHHPADSTGSHCIGCHMPMTEFARMRRSDHSMLPPTPAATLAFKSPNACNICHQAKLAKGSKKEAEDASQKMGLAPSPDATPLSVEEADKLVREWHKNDYQAPVLHRAGLVDAARKSKWERLPDIFKYLKSDDRDEVFTSSLVNLIGTCPANAPGGDKVRPAIIDRLKNDPSPMVRASAAAAMIENLDPPSIEALVGALDDEYRLVRIRAAAALAPVPPGMHDPKTLDALSRATKEYEASMRVRPDDSASHYNLGNFFMARRQLPLAIESFERSHFLDPRSIPPLVNVSLAYSAAGDNQKAEAALRKALKHDPCNAATNFNLGLLLAELKRMDEAEAALRQALKTEPNSAPAAFNLGVMLAESKPGEALTWCKKAVKLAPDNPKYAYTLAFYQQQGGDAKAAVETLVAAVARGATDASVYEILASLYQKHGEKANAAEAYRRGAADTKLPPQVRQRFEAMARRLAPK